MQTRLLKLKFSWQIEALSLSLLFCCIHFLVLRLIFPGYYDPFWPYHSDFYVPTAISYIYSYANGNMHLILQYPRPIGYLFSWAIGHLGIRGSIFAIFLLIVFNYTILVMILRRVFGISPTRWFFLSAAVFAFLLASHPFQIIFSIHDTFSQLSFLLLLIAVAIYINLGSNWLALLFVLLSFLSKETYGFSAVFLAGCCAIYNIRCDYRAAFTPMFLILTALGVMFFYNHYIGSVFVGNSATAGSTYEVVIQPYSIILQWVKYAKNGINILGFLLIVAVISLAMRIFGFSSSKAWTSIMLPLAGGLSWFPNSLLPHHYFPGYSWNGAYLIYAPIILIPLFVESKRRYSRLFASLILLLALCTPTLSKNLYKENDWMLLQQRYQKNILNALDMLIKATPTKDTKILISGINMPFSPFASWQAILPMHPNSGTMFYVVNYMQPSAIESSQSNNIEVATINPQKYKNNLLFDQVWIFHSDGSLRKVIYSVNFDNSSSSESKINASDLIFYPDLADLFDNNAKQLIKSTDTYLKCGQVFLSYNYFYKAKWCFDEYIKLNPQDPYSYFYLGQVDERSGDLSGAEILYQKAVKLDMHQKNKQNAFHEALKRIRDTMHTTDK